MATDDEIKASAVAKMHRKGHYDPRGVKVDTLAQWAAATHDRGRAKDLIHAMAKNSACPVLYKPGTGNQAVMLEHQSEGWAKNWILRHDPGALPFDME